MHRHQVVISESENCRGFSSTITSTIYPSRLIEPAPHKEAFHHTARPAAWCRPAPASDGHTPSALLQQPLPQNANSRYRSIPYSGCVLPSPYFAPYWLHHIKMNSDYTGQRPAVKEKDSGIFAARGNEKAPGTHCSGGASRRPVSGAYNPFACLMAVWGLQAPPDSACSLIPHPPAPPHRPARSPGGTTPVSAPNRPHPPVSADRSPQVRP